MTRTARKITFPYAGVEQGSRVWRNRETGIEIIKGKNFAEVGLYYVCHPTMDQDGRAVGFAVTTMHEARECAHRLARYMRIRIGRAHTEACLEDSDREGQRLAAIREDSERACDCDGSHAPTPGGHSVACRRREQLKLFGVPSVEECHVEALREDAERNRRRTIHYRSPELGMLLRPMSASS